MTSMTKKPLKILCSGDVNGKFSELIGRVSAVNKKCGPFDLLFCVGEFFGPNEEENRRVVDGLVDFPVETYILGPCCPSTSAYYPDESVEFSSTLTYLGRKGILNTANGLTVGYLSGIETTDLESHHLNAFEFNEDLVNDLLLPVRANSGFQGLDILLTSIWPAQVAKHSSNQPPNGAAEGSKLISRLAAGLKPRYHFAGFGPHYERSPYRNHRVLLEPAQLVTRFIGLSQVGNARKEKWLYAFSAVPMRKLDKSELTVQPDTTTEFPYMDILEELRVKNEAKQMLDAKGRGAQFFFDNDADLSEVDPVNRGGRKRNRPNFGGADGRPDARKRYQQQNVQPETCWFCLASADVAKHLIVAVGSSCYAAMPKGPLTDDHVLVMSIGHIQSLAAASDEIRAEASRFRDALSLMADRQGKVLCVFERNYKSSHLQLQCVPVPKSAGKALRSAFLNAARLKNIEFTFLKEEEQVWDLVNEGSPYFYVELPDGTRLFTRSMSGFPIQFGREVLCGSAILNAEERIDWRNCSADVDAETQLTLKLKAQFKPFDFTNENDSDDD